MAKKSLIMSELNRNNLFLKKKRLHLFAKKQLNNSVSYRRKNYYLNTIHKHLLFSKYKTL